MAAKFDRSTVLAAMVRPLNPWHSMGIDAAAVAWCGREATEIS
jgi:hypothetical protein